MKFSKSTLPFSAKRPFRTVRPASQTIIFLACEGSVTEEEYFERIGTVYAEIKSKIQFISVAEDAVHTAPKSRTDSQTKLLSKSRPLQLVERINRFKEEKESVFRFSQFPEDEFWIVTDADQNWSDNPISANPPKSYKDEWDEAIAACHARGCRYAVSNPFFELWLLLHHDDVTDEDRKYAVTEHHPYEPTDHFRTRLRQLGAPLKDRKHIRPEDCTDANVRQAVARARELHREPQDLQPRCLASTVYLLVERILNLLP